MKRHRPAERLYYPIPSITPNNTSRPKITPPAWWSGFSSTSSWFSSSHILQFCLLTYHWREKKNSFFFARPSATELLVLTLALAEVNFTTNSPIQTMGRTWKPRLSGLIKPVRNSQSLFAFTFIPTERLVGNAHDGGLTKQADNAHDPHSRRVRLNLSSGGALKCAHRSKTQYAIEHRNGAGSKTIDVKAVCVSARRSPWSLLITSES